MEIRSAELCETHSLASSSPSMMSPTNPIHNNNRFAGQENSRTIFNAKDQETTHTPISCPHNNHKANRSQKLKDARGEAAKEIETLKSKREDEFKEFEQQHSGNTDSQQKVLEEETKQKVSHREKTLSIVFFISSKTIIKPSLSAPLFLLG
ncbi:hypothetical protein PGTUg99_002520 [Puccinia graminis f. sp. tritici]|uniref:V-type proton ATPase subunit G n=1 Tax=Puccinia graminis f. sp. tritici TaxID=56615 RepID=A0A5B0SGG0_PUCGR|nr:hypothetical protein PGTUg99_002520 [Puccinia graminis f. sp. tritici]